ncbi:DUF1796 family putative cysteine peptidase [Agrobacterium rosae]|uniref:Papain-like cysteine peptidase (DUF1796) n=1 Tax=Agrobacterium rosae TaxID=1972867 RepID=A0A1R3TI69_9HYPH|nr:DUF1796 family putative cysteine peptidase [Agrobacterium rosae]SCX03057.1 hypothetical protein DSM25559_0285 [Agrobacterium rosae]
MHQYISLGAACNAATMMKIAGLRKASFPFDWLLNLNAGLSVVTSIIQDDFQKVVAEDCYQVVHHPPVGRAVPAYKDYPNTFHIHSDPSSNSAIHEEMIRRFERFRLVLRSSNTLHFVYYRNLSIYRDEKPDADVVEVLNLMLEEATQFLDTIEASRKGETFILLVLESDVEDTELTNEALKHVRVADQRISIGSALSRYDDNDELNAKWQQDWIELIINHTKMPIWMKLRCKCKRLFRAFRKQIKGKKLNRTTVEIHHAA